MTDEYDPRNLLEDLKRLLREMEWRFAEETERPALQMLCNGKNGLFTGVMQVMSDRPVICFYVYAQCRVPAEKRPAVAEFLARANYGLMVGNFELDFRDGEVRYKTSLAVNEAPLSAELLDPLLRANLASMDRYLPGLMSLLYNDLAAEDAVGLCEAA